MSDKMPDKIKLLPMGAIPDEIKKTGKQFLAWEKDTDGSMYVAICHFDDGWFCLSESGAAVLGWEHKHKWAVPDRFIGWALLPEVQA